MRIYIWTNDHYEYWHDARLVESDEESCTFLRTSGEFPETIDGFRVCEGAVADPTDPHAGDLIAEGDGRYERIETGDVDGVPMAMYERRYW